ncbi:MAG: hypothetical protein KAQ62_00475, partial [Cyclobacteriaceae bacterium]|nr:hypothetical protein [Cyclobacteriaceae bacterium]
EKGMKIPLTLAPWESTIIVFEEGVPSPHVTESNLDKIVDISGNTVSAEVSQNGSYFMNVMNDTEETFMTKEISNIPSTMVVNGNWKLILESDHFTKVEKELKYLSSWTDDEATKHFSGTGKYSIQFQLPEDYLSPDIKLELDLGKIGNIGEVEINGKNAGTIWMKGQKCDISHLVNKGENELTVYVTNTNINRVSAFKELVPVPDDLVDKFGEAKPATRLPREFGFEPLPPSGLMGPVKIIPVKMIKIQY